MALRRRLSIKTNWKNKNKEKKNDSWEREIEDYSEKSSVIHFLKNNFVIILVSHIKMADYVKYLWFNRF